VKHFINEKYKEKMIAPVPADLILVSFGTLFSYLFKFNEKWNVKIVGDIPLGLPMPSLPAFDLFYPMLSASINIAIVSFAINISMAKLFAKKYKYSLDANQVILIK
jgi:solute carrier family 26 protein